MHMFNASNVKKLLVGGKRFTEEPLDNQYWGNLFLLQEHWSILEWAGDKSCLIPIWNCRAQVFR